MLVYYYYYYYYYFTLVKTKVGKIQKIKEIERSLEWTLVRVVIRWKIVVQ